MTFRPAGLALATTLVVLPTLLGAEAQQPKPKVVFVAFGRLPLYEASFDTALRGFGWEDGRNVHVERLYIRSGQPLAEVSVEAVRRAPDVIVVPSAGIATAVKHQTTTIPIVVVAAGDLVTPGLVASLARPGGNVTGNQIVQYDLMGKRLQLLKDTLPRLTRVAALGEAVTIPPAMRADTRRAFETAARELRIEPLWYEVNGVGDLDDRFRAMAGEAHAVIVPGTPFMFEHASLLVGFAARNRIPATYEANHFVHAGGLMSYGTDFADVFARAADFVDKILRGANPGLLPIQQPTKFEFAINLKTARALGLTISQSLLQRADHVIE
jgi:putative ABC transport system substrate-binding protein